MADPVVFAVKWQHFIILKTWCFGLGHLLFKRINLSPMSDPWYNIEHALGAACAVRANPWVMRADSRVCSQHLNTSTVFTAAVLY